MANRNLVHESKTAEFINYLFYRYRARLVQPAQGEIFRVKIDDNEIGFAQRKNADHLTSWGIGTRLSQEFVAHSKRLN